jgi:CheY-like chemotaxis protein
MTPQKTRVLVIDDEPQILRALRINLSVRGYEVITAASGGEALRTAADHRPDVIVLDLGLPDMSGIEVLGGLRGWLGCAPRCEGAPPRPTPTSPSSKHRRSPSIWPRRR